MSDLDPGLMVCLIALFWFAVVSAVAFLARVREVEKENERLQRALHELLSRKDERNE